MWCPKAASCRQALLLSATALCTWFHKGLTKAAHQEEVHLVCVFKICEVSHSLVVPNIPASCLWEVGCLGNTHNVVDVANSHRGSNGRILVSPEPAVSSTSVQNGRVNGRTGVHGVYDLSDGINGLTMSQLLLRWTRGWPMFAHRAHAASGDSCSLLVNIAAQRCQGCSMVAQDQLHCSSHETLSSH